MRSSRSMRQTTFVAGYCKAILSLDCETGTRLPAELVNSMCWYICKSSKMEEEYERVKKLRGGGGGGGEIEPSWVLNPGPFGC